MVEPKDPVFINYLGEIPVNPDDLAERSLLVGPGTDRPLGFTFERIYFFYWNVRFFKFYINGALPPTDALSTFLTAGGAFAGSIGAAAGIGAVAMEQGLPSAFNCRGNTKIKIISRVKNRIKDQSLETASFENLNNINLAQELNEARKISKIKTIGDPDGPFAEKVLHIRRNKDNGKTGLDYKPVELVEGDLVAAGPVHIGLNNGTGGVGGAVIDFSNILFYKRQYWPKIIIFTPWGNSFMAYTTEYENEYGYKPPKFNLGYGGLSSIYANVTFDGGVIPIFYDRSLQVGKTGVQGLYGPFINGTITHKPSSEEDCCSRFYYDNSDQYRLDNSKECKSCEEQGVGKSKEENVENSNSGSA